MNVDVVVAHTDPCARGGLAAPLRRCGYRVEEAADFEQALAACHELAPDVALVSKCIESPAGGTLLDELKADPDIYSTAVVLVAPEEVPFAHAQNLLVGQGRRLETMLHEDALTGLFNRRYVLTRLGGLISGARRHRRALSVAMIDIDRFKRVNAATATTWAIA